MILSCRLKRSEETQQVFQLEESGVDAVCVSVRVRVRACVAR